MDPAIITLCVLGVAAFLFITELIPLAVTAMAACTALGILGVLPSRPFMQVCLIPPSFFFGGMFVIGAAMFKTGLAEAIGVAVVKKAGTNGSADGCYHDSHHHSLCCILQHRYSRLPDAGHHRHLLQQSSRLPNS